MGKSSINRQFSMAMLNNQRDPEGISNGLWFLFTDSDHGNLSPRAQPLLGHLRRPAYAVHIPRTRDTRSNQRKKPHMSRSCARIYHGISQ